MPWKETRVMNEKVKFIGEVLKGNNSIVELCRDYEISRKTAYKWIKRYEQEGSRCFIDKSRAPHNPTHKLEEAVVDEIIRIKKEYLHWGPKKIRQKLIDYNPDWDNYPAVSTVGEYLKEAGLVIPRIKRRRAVAMQGKLTQGVLANDVWCADFKGHFTTRDGEKCNPLTISDDYSRYLLYCKHRRKMDYINVQTAFELLFREYGLPLVIRTDNGTPFSARSRYGLSKLSFWWIRLGIYPERIEAGHPEQNGRHERMHRTLKKETTQPAAKNIKEQNSRFRKFQKEYNEDRPHEALNMNTPAKHYIVSNRRFPNKLPKLEYGIEMQKRKVQSAGDITYGGKDIFVSESLAGEYIGLEQFDESKSNVWYCNYKLGILDHKTGAIEAEIKKTLKCSLD